MLGQIRLGTMTFGEQNLEKESHEQLSYSLENGVNFIDTAEMYAIPEGRDSGPNRKVYWHMDRKI